MNNIRIAKGTYRAETDLVLSLMCGAVQKEYRTVKAGETFDVPHHVNQFWAAVTYYPDFGDQKPQFAKI